MQDKRLIQYLVAHRGKMIPIWMLSKDLMKLYVKRLEIQVQKKT